MSIATIERAREAVGQTVQTAPIISNQASPRWLVYYYVVQIVCQLALLPDAFASIRVFFRVSSFGMSLVVLIFTTGRKAGPRHPATPLALLVFAMLILEALHPDTATALSAFATLAMYAAILAPLFWVPRLALDFVWFRRVVLIIWSFQSLSALVGALQVYFPGIFQPATASVLSDNYLSALEITLASGEKILRPSGLSDAPGGAAVAGTYAALLALGLWTNRPKPSLRVLLAASIATSMFVLYLCEIRSLVVMVGISIFATALVHAARGRVRSVATIGLVASTIAFATFIAAVSVGGADVTRRLATLFEGSPSDVYYTSRGIFLEHTLTDLLPAYPLGAGLGRWGMIANYFGGGPSTVIWVEIQWTGWLLDGGVPLIVVYGLMLGVAVWTIWKTAKGSSRTSVGAAADIAGWAALLVGYDVGTVALTFNFPVFISSFGLDFWLLNAAFLSVAAKHQYNERFALSVNAGASNVAN